MNYKFFILGISNGGLFLARQLRKAWPECVIYGFGDPKKDIGRYSNVINGFYPIISPESIYQIVLQAYNDIGAGQVKAYICSNSLLETTVTKASEIFDFLEFDNTLEVYQQLVDKTMTDKLCKHLNINRPKGFSFEKDAMDDIIYPVVVKPLEKSLTIGAQKCAFIADKATLMSYLEKLDSLGIQRSHLICQQCVRGDNRWEYGYGGYFKNGEPLVDVFFYQFIQVPQGLCCYTREILDKTLQKNILSIVQPILKETNYCGVIEFDLKQDENTKEMYLLDINPRPWRSVDMLVGKISKGTIFNPVMSDLNVVWRYPTREISNRTNPKNTPYKICKTISKSKGREEKVVISLFDIYDIKPFLMQLLFDCKMIFEHLLKKLM